MSTDWNEQLPRICLEMGYLSMKMGSMPQAQTFLEAAQALRPEDPTPPMFMGMWHFAQGRYSDAERSYRQVLEQHETHDLTRAFLAEALIAQRRWAEAESILSSIVKESHDAAAIAFANELLSGLKLGVFSRAG